MSGFDDVKISTKLRIASVAALVCIAIVAGLGSVAAYRIDEISHRLVSEGMEPAAQLAKINELMQSNMRELFGAANHNPSFEAAKYHNHTAQSHVDAIEKNIGQVSEEVRRYKEGVQLDPALSQEYTDLRTTFLNEGLRTGINMVGEGKFSELAIKYWL